MKRIPSILAGIAFLFISTAVLLEAGLRIAEKLGFFYSQSRLTEPGFYRDQSEKFGVWHPPDFSFRAKTECFDVEYRSNSWGMRDRSRELEADGFRVAVLGDSFVEGIGVPLGDRMTDLLEKLSGMEHLNFGTAANFSSVQQWLLYTDLASRFDHDLILLFNLPANDFLENDPDRWWQKDRYRPYFRLKADGSGFEVWYPVSFEEAQAAADRQLHWNRVYNHLYIYRFFSWLDTQIRVRMSQGDLAADRPYSGYLDFTELDLERVFESYRRIRDAADGRVLVIFTIPRLADLVLAKDEGTLGELPARFEEFASRESNIEYVDLIPGFLEHAARTDTDPSQYFLPCDGHWSVLGNEVAAEVVAAHLPRLSPEVRTSFDRRRR